VNELIRREINEILHTRYQAETVAITVFEVSVAPDLRNAHIFYSVLGGGVEQDEAQRFFRKYGENIRREVGKKVVLKYLPKLKFFYDESMERGSQTLSILDELDKSDHDHDSHS
jgi:ribosome-binding factor A